MCKEVRGEEDPWSRTMLVMHDHYISYTFYLVCVITSRHDWRAAAEATSKLLVIGHVCMKCVCVCVYVRAYRCIYVYLSWQSIL